MDKKVDEFKLSGIAIAITISIVAYVQWSFLSVLLLKVISIILITDISCL